MCDGIWLVGRIVLVLHGLASKQPDERLPHMHQLCNGVRSEYGVCVVLDWILLRLGGACLQRLRCELSDLHCCILEQLRDLSYRLFLQCGDMHALRQSLLNMCHEFDVLGVLDWFRAIRRSLR